MKISLIGMSNSGKTHWSTKLEEQGFKRFCCDDMIEKKLGSELKRLGYSGIEDVAKWMGQPYDEQYPQTSKKYLDFEKEVMHEIIDYLQTAHNEETIVVDTTGSAIYTGDTIMTQLANLTKVVYLDTPDSVKKEMYEAYIANPKPVIWGDSYNQQPNETENQALARCYPELLAYRTDKYKYYAHETVPYEVQRSEGFTIKDFYLLLSSKKSEGEDIK